MITKSNTKSHLGFPKFAFLVSLFDVEYRTVTFKRICMQATSYNKIKSILKI